MVKTSQHLTGVGCQVKLKMWNFYVWLIICGFTGDVLCSTTENGKQVEVQTISTPPSNDVASEAQSYTEESSVDEYNDQKSDYSDLYRYSRSVPRDKSESSSESKSKNNRKHDYVLKIPLSLLRQYELYRLLRLQEYEENRDHEKRHTVIPVPRFGRANDEREYDMEEAGNIFETENSEQDNFSEEYLDELFKEMPDEILPQIRDSRSMLLLSSPKSEETAKEKPAQNFVVPYPRPGRSNKHVKVVKSKNEQLILPYPRPGRSEVQKQVSKRINVNSNNEKYILPIARVGRSSLYPTFLNEKDSLVIDDWLSGVKSNPLSEKLNKEKSPEKTIDDNEGSSFFVIPYPRPGKRTMFKLRNRNQEQKNTEKEISDYVLPYPRPGKKSGREKSTVLSSKSKGTENIDSQNFILPYPRPGRAHGNFFHSPNEEFEIFTLPYLRARKTFDNIIPYPRPGRSASQDNEASELFSIDMEIDSDGFQASQIDLKNLEDDTPDIFRYKRSSSVVPYPRPERSDSVVPYPRLGRSNSVVPYPRLGRSNSVVPYPRLGRSNSVVPYPRLGRSNSVVPYPRLGRSNSVVPYPRLGRSSSVVPYPRLGRSTSVVPYPNSGRSKRSSSVVPYPRLGRSDSVVPYPRPGRGESIVPYPRPGRADSIVPYPRPGRADSIVPYPRPGRAESVVPYPRPVRAESVVPYPRPGRAESVVPYPRPGRAEFIVPYPRPGRAESVVPYSRLAGLQIPKTVSPNNYDKTENWLLPNITPGLSDFKNEDNDSRKEYFAVNSRYQRSVDNDPFRHTDTNSDSLRERDYSSRYDKRTDGQGYVLPHPRIGRTVLEERKKKTSFDTDTVIPYPRLGRSEKETVPKESPENQNSLHKLNKHMLSNAENSVYLLPYPRPGRYLK